MATNVIRDKNGMGVIESVGADYSSGDFIVQGLLHGISLNDVATGGNATVQMIGEVSYAKAAGQVWTEGDELFFDAGNDEFTTIATTDGVIRGYAAEDALIAATSGLIRLCDGHYTAAGAFVTYDNGTSGLAATTVQDAIDEVEDRVDDLESEKMDLVATPTAGNLIEMDATGQGVDSGLATADVQVLTVPAAAGNLAGLDVGGTLTDSGIAAADVQVLTVPAAAGNLAGLDVGGTLTDSGIAAADVQVLAVPVAAGNVAELDATGAIADSGITAGEIDAAVLAGYNTTDGARNSTNTAQAVADSTATDIALEDAEFAGDVAVDVTFKEFTIPVSGVYAIAFSLTFDTAAGGTTRVADLLVNGTSRAGGEEAPSGAGPDVVEDYVILYLAATDVVKLAGFQDSGGPVNVTAGRLAIQRLQ